MNKRSKINGSKLLCIGLVAGIALAFSGGCGAIGSKVGGLFYSPTPVVKAPVTNNVPIYLETDILTPAKTNLNTGVITAPVAKPDAVALSNAPVVITPPPGTHYEQGAAWQPMETA